MELKEFIKTTLKEISLGIKESQEALKDEGVLINPNGLAVGANGDKYLKDGRTDFNDQYITHLTKEIFYTIKQSKLPISSYLVLTDNMEIKHTIVRTFPWIKILFNSIAHLGQGVVQCDEPIKNTLLEFYLMSRAASIISFSSYEHGSGFSQWCAKTYNIPYVCKF